ncbi:DUF4154 domain-containing protein [Sulfurimonas aquatica]|uniref:DUF4154 domain-containing protein n=1 Tax=Sulfurimonas aquatica TaxID=2672570 RepID=A0A975AZZ6_9BACT|nr:YfiR/HmsC family protein [Sulfurimonas aquatica]QSZ41598.1 DUF4154 domain-containing protein [Sulfurimonas aquatica]
MLSFLRCILLFSLLMGAPVRASYYDEDILDIYAKILPRFVLMTKQENIEQKKITICLVHEKLDRTNAKAFVKKVNNIYPDGIKKYPIEFNYTFYSHIQGCENTNLIFLFSTRGENLEEVVEFAKKKKILTASYDEEMIKYAADFSLFLGRKIVPYINMDSIMEKEIKLNNVLLQISKIYSKRHD